MLLKADINPLGILEEGEEEKYSGEWKGLNWIISDRGKLIASGSLTEKIEDFGWNADRTEYVKSNSWLEAPWKAYDKETRSAYMDFTGATSLFGLFYLGSYKVEERGRDVYYEKESNIEKIDLSNLDTSQVVDMDAMFRCCSKLASLDISGLDTNQTNSMAGMFASCSSLSSWT